ncbi:MAG TPA: YebC/PmpR family DNA-binding transcriptional regulator [Firmicutes bacterium]|jgi:YebC/PmpR family DNA-binding regulatory protein|nr:YebC/PmpR family DNA-binding transcriptional regulator [Bacillota bacterium]
MAGHSKWANVKHRKARADAQKGKIFTKIAREITVAAKEGGGDLDANFRLRLAVQKAREANLPNDNITRAIQRGLGELEGAELEQVTYEGYGPGGIAVLIDIMTDNRNRTAPEIRHIFSRRGGNMGESGCVAWMFKRKGYFTLEKQKSLPSEDDLMTIALENGADDFQEEDNSYVIITPPEEFENMRDAFREREIEFSTAEVTMVPENTIFLDDAEEAAKVLGLLEALEEHDDVQNVYANFDIPDELMQSLEN